jgi:hypothetical protein
MENHGSYHKDSLFILMAADCRHPTRRLALSALETDDQLVHGKRIRNANDAPELKMRTKLGGGGPNIGVSIGAPTSGPLSFLAALRRGVTAKGDFLFFLIKEPLRISFPLFFLYNSALGQSHKIGTKSHNHGTKRPGSATRKGQRPQKRDAGVL